MGLMDAARVRLAFFFFAKASSSSSRSSRSRPARKERARKRKRSKKEKREREERRNTTFSPPHSPPLRGWKKKLRPLVLLLPLFSPTLSLPPSLVAAPPPHPTPPTHTQSFIERNMQSAEERDQFWASYTRQVDDARKKMKAAWALPTKAPGFWRSPLSEARFESAHAPGIRSLRRKTIDEE